MTDLILPHPATHMILPLGGRVGERAEPAKVPAMRSIVGMRLEGGAETVSALAETK